jgi:hypothetical protein
MCFSLTNSATAWATLFPFSAQSSRPHFPRSARSRPGFADSLRSNPAQVGVDDKKFGIHGMGHARATGNQILRRRIRADAYRNAFADGDRRAIFSSSPRCCSRLRSTCCATWRNASSRKAIKFVSRKKFSSARPTRSCGYTSPRRIRFCSASGVRSIITTSLTLCSTQSGTVSRT